MKPVLLESNRPASFYRDSGALSAFRGSGADLGGALHPEDWIASTTRQFGRSAEGLTTLPDGRLLVDAIGADPEGWLGREHVGRFGPDPKLLVKLLDTGQRLPVHVHPNGLFASSHLGTPHGKTEAWLILEAAQDAAVHLGFARDVDVEELARWRADEDTESLLAATNRIPVSAGDTVFVPAGLPHAIGEGILLVELQEPTDFSIFLESRGFELGSGSKPSLGLPWEVALDCVNRAAVSPHRLAELRSNRGRQAFPVEADDFFRAERIEPLEPVELEAGYSVLIGVAGTGQLSSPDGQATTGISRGQTVLVPHSAGALTLSGDGLVVIRARPPA
jgi:mannose-6-phosphate isomerase